MRNLNYAALSASAATSQTGGKIDTGQIYAASFIASFTDVASAGTVKIQANNDPTNVTNITQDFTPASAQWVDIPSASAVVAAGATINIPMPVQISYRWLRVVWTRTAGAGTITVNINSQGV